MQPSNDRFGEAGIAFSRSFSRAAARRLAGDDRFVDAPAVLDGRATRSP